MSWRRIRAIVVKEFIQTFRNPRMRVTLIVPPILQIIVLGYAIELDVRHARVAVLDRDRSAVSRGLVDSLGSTGKFHMGPFVETPGEGSRLLDRGKANLLLEIPLGLGEDVLRRRPASVQAVVDGTDATFAGLLTGQFAGAVETYNQELLRERGLSSKPPIEVRERGWFNPNLQSRTFFVPGVIAMLVLLVTLQLTSMAVVREKEFGTLEQLMVSPLTPLELLLGKTVPFVGIALVNVATVTVVARLLFGIRIAGSPTLLVFCTLLYLLSCLGAGLLISTISRTQQQAMMTTFLFLLPANLLSGFAFPVANMPLWVQAVTWLDPLRFFLVIIRGIILKGVGMDILWPEMLTLLVLGLLFFGMGTLRFHRTLD